MGIRIHKALGFALTDYTDGDPRIDDKALGEAIYPSPERAAAIRSRLRAFLEANEDGGFNWLAAASLKDDPEMSLDRCVTVVTDSATEEGVALLLIQPDYVPEWYRSDDTIDYYEADLAGQDTQTTLRELDGAPFPFDGAWMDSQTGVRLRSEWTIDLRRAVRDGQAEFAEVCATKVTAVGSKQPLYSNAEEAASRIVPNVPSPVRYLAEAAGLFTSPDVWLQLRPVLATWWC